MNFVDLFAGAGGLSEGFIRSGLRPVAHVEMDKAACYTLKTRMSFHWLSSNNQLKIYKDYLRGKITRDELYVAVPENILNSVINSEINSKTISKIFSQIDELRGTENIDVIVGGPPCQAYSVVGRSRDREGMEGDSRNYLYKYYARFLNRYQPKYFVFENVTGLESASGGKYLKNMKSYFKRVGYELDHKVLNALDFGVLQNRKRVIIIGWKKGEQFSYPIFEPERSKFKVKVLLRDLDKLQAGEGIEKNGRYTKSASKYLHDAKIRNGINVLTQHIARPHIERDKEIYKIAIEKWNKSKERLIYSELSEHLQTHQNKITFLDRFKVVASEESYSQTVVAHIAKDGHYYIHPSDEQNRSISVREAARLQSFPDDYYFEGEREKQPRTAAFKQIGNAVPPLMAEKIADKIIEELV